MFKRETKILFEKTGRFHKQYIYECDECHNEFVKGRCYTDKITFCCKECYIKSSRSGIAKQQKEQHFLEKYGVTNPYGCREIIENRKKNLIEKYGVENVSQIQDVKDKKAQTFLEHYGTTNNFGRAEVRQNIMESLLDKFGTTAPTTHPDVKQKLNSHETKQKHFASLKRNGTIKESRPERRLVVCFQTIFDDLETHVTVNGWSIDFYIKSIDTYFQVDGVYWHGLNRPIEKIIENVNNGNHTDKMILGKYNRDKEQNIWFFEQNKKLVRITDLQINAMNDEQMFEFCNSYKL